MKKDIYKITNKINKKIYIGQSSNPQERFYRHIHKHSSSKLLGKDIDIYGMDNFELEIIEKNIENFQKRERYWIKFYRDKGCILYNIKDGGEEPPTYHGEESGCCIYSDKQVEDVTNLILNTNYNFNEIGKKTNTNGDFARKVNEGHRKILKENMYPIRTETHFDKISKLVIEDLKNTTKTQKEIAKQYGVARSMVTMINIGQNRFDKNLDYPIRRQGVKQTPIELKEKIYKELLNGEIPYRLYKKYKVNMPLIYSMQKEINENK